MFYWKETKDERGRKLFVATNICENCTLEYNCNSPASSKYCPDCGERIRREQNRARVAKYRAAHKKAVTDDL